MTYSINRPITVRSAVPEIISSPALSNIIVHYSAILYT